MDCDISVEQADVYVLNAFNMSEPCIQGVPLRSCPGTKQAIVDLELDTMADVLSRDKKVNYTPVGTRADHKGHEVETVTPTRPASQCGACGALVCAQAVIVDRNTPNATVAGTRIAYTRATRESDPEEVSAIDLNSRRITPYERDQQGNWRQA